MSVVNMAEIVMILLMILTPTFVLLQGGVTPCSTAALQHAGIRDGDGMKKSGSKHHTKEAPWACRRARRRPVLIWFYQCLMN